MKFIKTSKGYINPAQIIRATRSDNGSVHLVLTSIEATAIFGAYPSGSVPPGASKSEVYTIMPGSDADAVWAAIDQLSL